MTPPSGDASATLGAVWGTDSAHVWVGDAGAHHILFYNGSTWVDQATATQTVYAVWGTSTTNVFAAGGSGMIMHYNGTSWSTQTSNTTSSLRGLGGSSGSDVWAVGSSGTTVHYNGSAWSVVGPTYGVPMSAVTNGTTTPWAVGGEGSLMSYTGSAWQLSTQSGLSLNGVWASSASDVFVATLGTVLHYNGTSWTSTYVTPGDSMTAIWGTGAVDSVFAVSAVGDGLLYVGGTWTSLKPAVDLYSAWGTSSTTFYAGSTSGNVEKYSPGSRGSAWSALAVGSPAPSATVQTVWGTSSSNLYGGLSNGTVYNYNGSAWTQATLPAGFSDVYSVYGSSASDVYVVGNSGSIAHYSGSGSWTAMTSNTSVPLRAAWADAAPGGYTADAYAVGGSGTVQHYNGAAWLNMPTPAAAASLTLRAIYGTSATNLYVVGDQGTVLLGTQ
jgi:hypothetical protein